MAKQTKKIKEYGLYWDQEVFDPLKRVFYCIQHGGQWTDTKGNQLGASMFDLYQRAFKLCWPNEDLNRWTLLILEHLCKNKVTVVMGPKSTNKTHTCSKWALIDYWAAPEETCTLISSTEGRGAELRIWGDVKSLWESAHQRFEWLAGHSLESKHAITTDQLGEDCQVRDMRKAIILIPVKNSSGRYTGLGSFAGIKNKRVRLIGDELQFIPPVYLDVPSNLDSNPDFKCALLGNPLDPSDALGRAAEPIQGWTSMPEPTHTTVWQNKFMGGWTVNLVGTDSPNFDPPLTDKPRYPYLINADTINSTVMFYGKDSQQYWSQCAGIMKVGILTRRVLTREIAMKFHALDDLVWNGTPRIKIYAADIAYGSIGGDRCIGGWIEFGTRIDGTTCISIHKPTIIPVVIGKENPEDIIARFIMQDCQRNVIPPENVFYDATGRGSMGTAFARVWSSQVNPVEFGGSPTDRPVCDDLYFYDMKEHKRRLKKCSEHYSKLVTEFWFSVRYAIESDQVRNLQEDVLSEGCQREWKIVRNNLIEVEAKEEMKERTGRSPDQMDWLAIAIEGARQKGFKIRRIANDATIKSEIDWLDRLKSEAKKLHQSHQLSYN